MKLTTTALAAILAIAYPFFLGWPDVYLARAGIDLAGFLKPGVGSVLISLVVRGGLLMLFGYAVAIPLLRLLQAPKHADALTKRRNFMGWGLAGAVVYLLSAPVVFVMSAVPYGGGGIPNKLHLLLFASWLVMVYGVARTLFQDLPAARRKAVAMQAAQR